jgi:hypothetical protein
VPEYGSYESPNNWWQFSGWSILVSRNTTEPGSPNVGSHVFDDELYVASTAGLYRIESTGTSVFLGTLNSNPAEGVFFADNGVTMAIVLPGDKSYFYDKTNGLVQITDSVFAGYESQEGGVRTVSFLNGYFVFNTFEVFFISSLVSVNDGKNFDALDFTRPFLREKCLRCAPLRGDLLVCGENQIEMYGLVGTADFPFSQIQGATIDKGLEKAGSLIVFDNAFFFFGSGQGERPAVWRGLGQGSVSKISTDFVDSQWDSLDINSITSYAFMLDGRPYIGFTPFDILSNSVGGCFMYDLLTSAQQGRPVWFQIETKYPSGGWFIGGTNEAYSRIFVIGADGAVDYLDKSTNEEEGVAVIQGGRVCRFSGQYLTNLSYPIFIHRLELIAQTGLANDGNLSTKDLDPQVELEYSDDGGNTFHSCGSRSMGLKDEFNKRIVWNRLGRTPNYRVFRFTTETGIPSRFIRIDINADRGSR